MKPEICEIIYLNDVETDNSAQNTCYYTTCIKKTCWLKIFQRVCKKKIQKKLKIIQKRKHPKSIMYRQIHGKWKI